MKLNENKVLMLLDIIEDETDAIIQYMRSLVDTTEIYKGREEKRILPDTQVSNLVNLARSTDSVEAIVTWIQYQIGRTGGWKHNDFGEHLVQAIYKMRDVAFEASRLVSVDNDELHEYTRYLWIRFVRQYVGHMQRYITYRAPKKG